MLKTLIADRPVLGSDVCAPDAGRHTDRCLRFNAGAENPICIEQAVRDVERGAGRLRSVALGRYRRNLHCPACGDHWYSAAPQSFVGKPCLHDDCNGRIEVVL